MGRAANILWLGIKGVESPAPRRSIFDPGSGHGEAKARGN